MGEFSNRQRRPALVVPVYRPPTPKLSTHQFQKKTLL
jgi:hypothetical protein